MVGIDERQAAAAAPAAGRRSTCPTPISPTSTIGRSVRGRRRGPGSGLWLCNIVPGAIQRRRAAGKRLVAPFHPFVARLSPCPVSLVIARRRSSSCWSAGCSCWPAARTEQPPTRVEKAVPLANLSKLTLRRVALARRRCSALASPALGAGQRPNRSCRRASAMPRAAPAPAPTPRADAAAAPGRRRRADAGRRGRAAAPVTAAAATPTRRSAGADRRDACAGRSGGARAVRDARRPRGARSTTVGPVAAERGRARRRRVRRRRRPLSRDADAPARARRCRRAGCRSLLRRALLSQVDTPRRRQRRRFRRRARLAAAADGRIGRRARGRAGVDTDNYTPKLYQVAMQTALATGDPAALCPLADAARCARAERGWIAGAGDVRRAVGQSGAGEPLIATARASRRRAAAIDLLLAQKVVGAGRAGAAGGDDRMGRRRSADRVALRPGDGDRRRRSPTTLYGDGRAAGADTGGRCRRCVDARRPARRRPRLRRRRACCRARRWSISTARLRRRRRRRAAPSRDRARSAHRLCRSRRRRAADGAAPAVGRAERRGARYARLVLTARAAARMPADAAKADADRLIASMLSRRARPHRGALARHGRRAAATPGRCSRWPIPTPVAASSYGDVGAYAGRRRRFGAEAAHAVRRAGRARPAVGGAMSSARRESLDVRDRRGEQLDARARSRRRATASRARSCCSRRSACRRASWRGVPPEALYHIVARAARGRAGRRGADDRRRGDRAARDARGSDRALIDRFLEMMAAEAGAAANTLAAYRSDLTLASQALGGGWATRDADALATARRAAGRRCRARPSRANRRRCGASSPSSPTRATAPTIPARRCRGPARARALAQDPRATPMSIGCSRRSPSAQRARSARPQRPAALRAGRAALRLGPARDRTGRRCRATRSRPTGRS